MTTYYMCSHRRLPQTNATCVSGSEHTHTPVVVIDPEKIPLLKEFHDDPRKALEMIAEDVRRVGRGDLDAIEQLILWLADQLPKPPKPDEPKGLGAVVKDSEGKKWGRVCEHDVCNSWRPFTSAFGGGDIVSDIDVDVRRFYSDIDVVEILSEGVTE